VKPDISSYWKIFRFIFVIFSLYLLGDAFYRWDGFRYHASFIDFLPNLALITVLWTIVAIATSLFIWFLSRASKWFCLRMGCNITTEHWLFLTVSLVILGSIVWVGKKNFAQFGNVVPVIQLLILVCVILLSILISWRFHNKAGKWIQSLQDQITPIVFLFGTWLILSVLLVIYQVWIKQTDPVVQQTSVLTHPTNVKQPNILLVTFDALTSRDMSVYGYNRKTTPFINEWAKTANVFTRATAASNFTRTSVTSLMTGKRVWTTRVYHADQRSGAVNMETENLALLLRNHGYFNIAILASSEAASGAVYEHFDSYTNWTSICVPTLTEFIEGLLFKLFGKEFILYDWFIKEDFILSAILDYIPMDLAQVTSRRPALAFKKFTELLDRGVPTPYFAWIHIYPPHFPYLPTEPYKGEFDPSSELRTFESQRKLINEFIETQDEHMSEMPPAIEILKGRYDELIRYCDDQFKAFITNLDRKNKLRNTIIILSSDHGESFDHNTILHAGPHLFESMVHIPLIIKQYGQTNGRIINENVAQIDIPATILDLTDINIPSWMEGRSLVPLLQDSELQPRPIFSMNFENNKGLGHRITEGTIAVWEEDHKLIHYLGKNKSLLFDLKQDPDELIDLFEKEPVVGNHLLSIIRDNLKIANDKISNNPDAFTSIRTEQVYD